jgi:hypothetical protein
LRHAELRARRAHVCFARFEAASGLHPPTDVTTLPDLPTTRLLSAHPQAWLAAALQDLMLVCCVGVVAYGCAQLATARRHGIPVAIGSAGNLLAWVMIAFLTSAILRACAPH